jgi:hypothetical protein
MAITPGEAARLTGLGKTTLARVIKAGRPSGIQKTLFRQRYKNRVKSRVQKSVLSNVYAAPTMEGRHGEASCNLRAGID